MAKKLINMLTYDKVEIKDLGLVECPEKCSVRGDYIFCYLSFPKCPVYQARLDMKKNKINVRKWVKF